MSKRKTQGAAAAISTRAAQEPDRNQAASGKPQTERHKKRAAAEGPSNWPLYATVAIALIAVWWAYGPAMHAPFVFDDTTLIPMVSGVTSFMDWVRRIRPLLMLTYWGNLQISSADTFSFHVVNVLIHCIASAIMYLVVRRMLDWAQVEARSRSALAGFCALLFLLHPLQSEAVAYLAGRSESLSTLFFYAAFAVFIYRRQPAVTWKTAAGVIVLFILALASKEQTIALPALLLLTDFWWNPQSGLSFSFRGIRDNWKLYAPMALGAIAGVVHFAPLIFGATTAGFSMKDLTWYQYLFTEFRAIFVYIREFVAPVGLNADWEFPFSRTIFDHGAIFGLLALVALAALAWRYRREFPLAGYGYFAFLLLLAPTSSILPIKDPVAERRAYFAMFGLLLIVADFLRRVKISRPALAAACGAVLLLFTVATHVRAEVWSSELSLWQDSTAKSPDKARDHFQLANAYYNAGECPAAVTEFEKTSRLPADNLFPPYNLLLDWGLALDCAGQPDLALVKLREAAGLERTAHVYTQMAKVYGGRGDWTMFDDALARAQAIDAGYAPIYAYRGIKDLQLKQPAQALAECSHALQLDPALDPARGCINNARQQMVAGGRR